MSHRFANAARGRDALFFSFGGPDTKTFTQHNSQLWQPDLVKRNENDASHEDRHQRQKADPATSVLYATQQEDAARILGKHEEN